MCGAGQEGTQRPICHIIKHQYYKWNVVGGGLVIDIAFELTYNTIKIGHAV